ncbi:DNA-packaging protein [Clostridiaceae bacterium]|nr:DNA-packaging protein [Clostridiaceae bacterium]
MGRSAKRAPPAPSEGYLAEMRDALRIAGTDFDGELASLIRAARCDLALCGVRPELVKDETDPLIKRAVTTYVKAEFGLDNADADKYRAAYGRMKIALGVAAAYIVEG